MKRIALLGLLVLSTACADHSVTQYVGTVMNEAAPEKQGSLRLTLYSRTDTSFSGVIELGAPARGTGGAYAWHEGTELRVVTVGAERRDTILWSSRLTEAAIGGRFEVTGGERAGQTGTWRARLVKGPPVSSATLRAPRPSRFPPPAALWPAALLLAASVGLAGWIRRAPRRDPASADGVARLLPPSSDLSGIGGWLALFTLGQAFSIVAWVARVQTSLHDQMSGMGIGAVVSGMRPLLVLETSMFLLTLPVLLGGLSLLLRRSPLAPRFWFAYLALSVAYLLLEMTVTPFVQSQMARLVGTHALPELGRTLHRQLWQFVVTIAWTVYWIRSRRVRATFGTAALDRTVAAPDATGVAPAVPAAPAAPVEVRRDGRWWRRVALRAALGAAGAFVVLLAIGLWSTRASPYPVPEGGDIRATVAGRWAWGSDSARCRSAHTIAFADGGRVMTITSGDIGASDAVTTYDVLSVSRSTIRGAIRGETRRTRDGKPVVWDLVLTGSDEYRWKRTDWRSTPWSYTGVIRRCPAAP